VPDVVTLAKAIGGGLPIGACVAGVAISFGPGDHASTFGGGPVPCAAALAVIETIEREGLLDRARRMGARLRAAIEASTVGTPVREVRGRGLLLGVQLSAPLAHAVALAMIDEGVLCTEAGPDVVRMSPPLIVEPGHVDEAAAAFASALGKVTASTGWMS
jgi:acetylornithine aminotransferase